MLTQRESILELMELLEAKYDAVYNELSNVRPCETGKVFAGLMTINKPDLDQRVDSMMSVLKSIKKIKEYK